MIVERSASPAKQLTKGASRSRINAETPLPLLFNEFPESRVVFNRYGLRGCGGGSGPAESIEFFSRAHGVPLTNLLSELASLAADEEAQRNARQQLALDAQPKLEDAIYRPFFLAAITVMLTVGAAWGTMILWRIGLGGSYTGVGIHEINAHGHAQIMGWVILFIMGFAYQAFPRMWQTSLPTPRIAILTWLLALAGMTMRGVAMMFAEASWARVLHAVGGVGELLALAGFVGILLVAYRRSQQAWQPYLGFVFAALLFMMIHAVFGVWHHDRLIVAHDREALLAQLADFQAPLRDLQIHGMALLMIVGVGLRMFPAIFGLPEMSNRRSYFLLGLLGTAVVLEVALFIAYRMTENTMIAAGLLLPWMMLLIGAIVLISSWGMFRTLPEPGSNERSAKFVQVAFGWLLISLVLLLLLPVYQWVSGIPFSHAYFGSVRHAITVGFISLMIVGMASKVVPTLRGISGEKLSSLWVPFVLINLGCTMRVGFQILTDWHPIFFKLVGVSGMLEWTGFLIWGAHLAAIMLGLGKYHGAASPAWGPKSNRISADHRVAQVLAWYPELETIFLKHRFALINHPILRQTVARQISLKQACQLKNVNLASFLSELNESLREADLAAEDLNRACQSGDRRLLQLNHQSQ